MDEFHEAESALSHFRRVLAINAEQETAQEYVRRIESMQVHIFMR